MKNQNHANTSYKPGAIPVFTVNSIGRVFLAISFLFLGPFKFLPGQSPSENILCSVLGDTFGNMTTMLGFGFFEVIAGLFLLLKFQVRTTYLILMGYFLFTLALSILSPVALIDKELLLGLSNEGMYLLKTQLLFVLLVYLAFTQQKARS